MLSLLILASGCGETAGLSDGGVICGQVNGATVVSFEDQARCAEGLAEVQRWVNLYTTEWAAVRPR